MVSDAARTSHSTSHSELRLDLVFENHGSIFLIRPISQIGRQWLDENVGDENTQMFGDAIACEPRYVEAIFRGAQSDGLTVRG